MLAFFTNNLAFSLMGLALILLLMVSLYLFVQMTKVKKKLKVFFQGGQATDLEGVLAREIKELKKAQTDIKELFKSSKVLEKMAQESIQKVGVIRFNPFKETGGDQSFAIALLDKKDNGLVISSLFSREGTRVYSKPIKTGQSEYPLSQEEEKALRQAGLRQ